MGLNCWWEGAQTGKHKKCKKGHFLNKYCREHIRGDPGPRDTSLEDPEAGMGWG